MEDIRFCRCGGYIEAGGDSTCTCNEDLINQENEADERECDE